MCISNACKPFSVYLLLIFRECSMILLNFAAYVRIIIITLSDCTTYNLNTSLSVIGGHCTDIIIQ